MFFLKKAILAKIEASYGVDPTPTGAANAILAKNVSITPLDQELKDREVAIPDFGDIGSIPIGTRVMIEFEVDMAGAGTAGNAPAWGPLHRACRLSETLNPGVDATYALVQSGMESVAIYFNLDGFLCKLTGCRGELGWDLKHNETPVWKYKFTGIYNAPTDTTLPALTLTAWQKPLPVNKVNTTFSLHSYSAILESLGGNLGNNVVHKDYPNATETVRALGGRVRGQATIEHTSVATKDWFGLAVAGTTGALALTHGTTAGNKVQFSAAAVQLANPNFSDSDGIAMLNLNLIFQSQTGAQISFKAL